MLYVFGPAASTAAAYIALLGCGTISSGVDDCGPMGPGLTRCCVILRV